MATRMVQAGSGKRAFRAPSYAEYARVVRASAFYAAVLFSAFSTAAFAAVAVRPQSPIAWLLTLGIALGIEALLHALKLGLREDPRWLVGWVALIVDAGTNAGGVYLIAPAITSAPGLNLLLAGIGADARHPLTVFVICLAIGIMLSVAPAALIEREEGGNGGV